MTSPTHRVSRWPRVVGLALASLLALSGARATAQGAPTRSLDRSDLLGELARWLDVHGFDDAFVGSGWADDRPLRWTALRRGRAIWACADLRCAQLGEAARIESLHDGALVLVEDDAGLVRVEVQLELSGTVLRERRRTRTTLPPRSASLVDAGASARIRRVRARLGGPHALGDEVPAEALGALGALFDARGQAPGEDAVLEARTFALEGARIAFVSRWDALSAQAFTRLALRSPGALRLSPTEESGRWSEPLALPSPVPDVLLVELETARDVAATRTLVSIARHGDGLRLGWLPVAASERETDACTDDPDATCARVIACDRPATVEADGTVRWHAPHGVVLVHARRTDTWTRVGDAPAEACPPATRTCLGARGFGPC